MTGVPQPSGTVTLVFTDIEGSTRLLEELGTEGYREALAEHRRIVREACARHDGYEVDTEGDAFFYAFQSAQHAVVALGEAMQGLHGGPIRIRVGIHTGEPALDPPKYLGIDVHRAARIMSAGHGGQVVLSPATVALLDGTVALKPLGEHRLKDMSAPLALSQLLLEGLPDVFPPLKTLYHSNLPVPATAFLGREQELAQVVERLTRPDTRLLTLTGPGGTGKTRLALQAAADVAETCPDGVFWVALAPLRDPALLLPSVAGVLDIREQPGEPLLATLTSALRTKRLLLLLDNAEHLLPHAGGDVAALLAGCTTLRVLVTSRERLRIGAETTWPVPPLIAGDGERLFVERARNAGVELEPDDTVRALCEQLDELPLAIELAAARTRVLSPAAILERLDDRLGLLASRDHDVGERQRTLEATVAWSYDLLAAYEQRVLRGLSVFAGGCTLDAAEQVAGADLDVIEALVDKSLLRHRIDSDGGDRYWMLETIREYAQARLEDAGEADAVFESFLGWVAGMVGEIDEYWIDRDQLEWFAAIDGERANFMHALDGCRARGDVDRAVRLVVAAVDFIEARGPYSAFLELIDTLQPSDPALVPRVELLRSGLLVRIGRLPDASAAALAAETAAAGDALLESRVLSLRAFLEMNQGHVDEARALAARAFALALIDVTHPAWAEAMGTLGLLEITCGELEPGLAHLRESRAVWQAIGDRRNLSVALGNETVGLLAARRPAEAIDIWHEEVAIARALEDPYLICTSLGNLGIVYAAIGDAVGARSATREAIEMDEVSDLATAEGLIVLALVAAQEGSPERAITLWAAGMEACAELGYNLGPELAVYVADLLEPLRETPDFDRHWQAGRSLSIEEAIELGLRAADS